jgi:hypothetical protein
LESLASFAYHQLEVSVGILILLVAKCQKFGFYTNDLLISIDQNWCHCSASLSNLTDERAFAVKKPETNQV